MANPAPTRLENLLAALALGLHDDTTRELETATQLSGSGPTTLLALDEFLGGANIGRLADVLGLTHSGAVRLVALLEAEGLAERWAGEDRRNVEVKLTSAGRRRASRPGLPATMSSAAPWPVSALPMPPTSSGS